MFSFSLRCSVRRCSTRYTVLLLILSLSFAAGSIPANSQSTQKDYAGAVQSTPDPIIPCTTSGFSVDATLLYPYTTANQTTILHRIDRNLGSFRAGFIVTRDTVTTERRLLTYEGQTMMNNKNVLLEASTDLDYAHNSASGEVYNGSFYLARLVNGGRLGCTAGFTCVSLSKWDFNANKLGEVILGSINTPNIDDVRLNGASTLLMSVSNAAGFRTLMTFSIPGASFIAVGGNIGPGNPGTLAIDASNGYQYVGYNDAARTVKQIQLDSVTVNLSGNFVFAVGDTLTTVYPVWDRTPTGIRYMVGESNSFGGSVATRDYQNGISLVDIGQTFYILADGGAVGASTFYDYINNKMYSFRDAAGPNLIRTDGGGTIEQRYNCPAGCLAASNKLADFVLQNGRLYVTTEPGGGNGKVNRIKVCATGGPPA